MRGQGRFGIVPRVRALLVAVAILLGLPVPGGASRLSPQLTPGAHRFTSGGAELVYHVAGSGPVVVVHPGGPGIEWSFVRMPRLEKFATVVYLEPIGTGASGRLADAHEYKIPRYVADVEGLRAHLGLERFVLLGHSHGGFVAQAYALEHQSHLRGLVLYDTSPTTGPEWQKAIEANLQWFKDEPWFQEAKAALAQETTAKTDEEMTAVFRREMPLYFAQWTARAKEFEPFRATVQLTAAPGSADTDSTASAQVGVAPVFEVRDRLGSIATPTLVLVGARDFVTDRTFATMLHNGIPGSQLVVLEKSGHMGHIEEPEAFARSIRAFLKSLPR